MIFNCSDEILYQIFSSHSTLKHSDIFHLILTSRRFYLTALPLLYRSLQFHDPLCKPRYGIPWSLMQMLCTIVAHPDRASWVQSSQFFWPARRVELWHYIFDFLPRLSSLYDLKLVAAPDYRYDKHKHRHQPRTDGECSLSQFIPRLVNLPLRSLDVEDIKLDIEEITDLYAFAHLKYLRITKFHFMVLHNMELSVDKEYPPSGLTSLEFWRAPFPMGRYAKYLLKNHPFLKSLGWVIGIGSDTTPWSSQHICEAMGPLKTTLTELHLSIIDSQYFNTWAQMNFVGFTSLRILTTHEKMIFASDESGDVSDRMDLAARLPSSLEDFTIIFDSEGRALLKNRFRSRHEWILTLGRSKYENLTRLSRVTLLERQRWGDVLPRGGREVDLAEKVPSSTEWKYPEEVTELFDVASRVINKSAD